MPISLVIQSILSYNLCTPFLSTGSVTAASQVINRYYNYSQKSNSGETIGQDKLTS